MPVIHKHFKKLHKLSNGAQYLGEVIYGAMDGIVTTFSVVAGFVGAGSGNSIIQMGPIVVILFGLANLFGDGVSMALGRYLSTKSQQDIYHHAWQQEHHDILANPEAEYEESVQIFMKHGMKEADASQVATVMKHYPHLRVKRLMDNELGLADAREEKPITQSFITLGSFVIFGFIPLIPYVILGSGYNYRIISLVMTSLALLLLGVIRWFITRVSFVSTLSQVFFLGAAAAAVAYRTGQLVMKMQ